MGFKDLLQLTGFMYIFAYLFNNLYMPQFEKENDLERKMCYMFISGIDTLKEHK